jgi:hypothetical protein
MIMTSVGLEKTTMGQETAVSSPPEYGWSLVFTQPPIWGIPNKFLMIVFKLSGQKFEHENNVGRRKSYLYRRKCVEQLGFLAGRPNDG